MAWAPGVGLDVHVLGAGEEAERPVAGEVLGDVDELAAAVVALAGQALGVLVGQPAALGLHHRRGGVVLGGDQLDLVVLATALALHRGPQLRIEIGDRGISGPDLVRDPHRALLHPWTGAVGARNASGARVGATARDAGAYLPMPRDAAATTPG